MLFNNNTKITQYKHVNLSIFAVPDSFIVNDVLNDDVVGDKLGVAVGSNVIR